MTMQSDDDYMAQAIKMADAAVACKQLPYGAVVVDKEGNIAGSGSQDTRFGVAYHAEIVAMDHAGGQGQLEGYTLYTTVEPCPMCSFAARLCKISRVVYGLQSPVMGGVSHFHVLDDEGLNKSEMGVANIGFTKPPVIVGGCSSSQIWDQWRKWNVVAAEAMQVGGVLR